MLSTATLLLSLTALAGFDAPPAPPQHAGPPLALHAVTNRAFTGIPSLAVSRGGRLWATWYAGPTPGEDQNNYVVLSTSGDNGKTWKEALIVDPDAGGPRRTFDPELWLAPDGKLRWFWADRVGRQSATDALWMIELAEPDSERSAWKPPACVARGVMMCKPTLLSTGEWVLPVCTWFTDQSSKMVVSTDSGKTWSIRGGASIPKPDRTFDEHSFIERKDRSMWVLSRTKYGIGESVSHDRGRSWPEETRSAIQHPSARFFITRLASGNLLLVKHGPIGTRTGRSHLTAYVSTDDGRTWGGGLSLDERNGVSYPDGQQTADGLIRIIYDYHRTTDRQILLATFREEDAAAGKAVSAAVRMRQLVSAGSGGLNKPKAAAPPKRSALVRPPLATALFAALAAAPSRPAPTGPDTWKAGAASVAITPERPTWMAGYGGRNKPSEGKFQDLFAKALVLEDFRGQRLVVVTLDLITVPRPLRDFLAAHLQQKHHIDPQSLLMNCSHTHSGPVVRITKSVIYPLTPEQMKAVELNLHAMEKKLVALVDAAVKDLAPARLGYCHARAGFAMNRRLPSETGFRNSPNPEGPVDHDVPVLRVERPDGKLRAVLFGYACHNTTLGLYQFCGDYAGYAQEYLEAEHPGAVALFMIGCGADQNPYPRGKLEQAQQHGRTLANAVEAALMPKPRPVRGPMRVAMEDLPVGFVDVPSPEQLREQAKSTQRYEKRRAEMMLDEIREKGKLRDSYPFPVQVICFDHDLMIVTLGGEVVVDYALRLKRELRAMPLWVAGYSNDVFAYVPSARVAKEGGYEGGAATVLTTLPGPFTPQMEEQIVGKVHQLVRQLEAK